jgi:hypothetical protein
MSEFNSDDLRQPKFEDFIASSVHSRHNSFGLPSFWSTKEATDSRQITQ